MRWEDDTTEDTARQAEINAALWDRPERPETCAIDFGPSCARAVEPVDLSLFD